VGPSHPVTFCGQDQAKWHDLVGYRQHAVWLSHEELEQLIAELRQAIVPRLANQPTQERARYLLSLILFPLEPSPAAPLSE
jgi:hypothetical protein